MQPAGATIEQREVLVLNPGERREAILNVIRSARCDLALSVFRCDDFIILDALADAVQRKVRVRALVTPSAKNWDRRLRELEVLLDSMGATVVRFRGAQTKYHAKYMVADDGPALIASLNLTRKCFDETSDFIVVTHHPGVVAGLLRLFEADCMNPDAGLPPDLCDSLIVGPEQARSRFMALLHNARQTIRIADHRLSDPEILGVLRRQQASGVSVQVLGEGAMPGLVSHGRMVLVDGTVAVIGSTALSPPSLNERREVCLVLDDPRNVDRLRQWFDNAARLRPDDSLRLAEFVDFTRADDDDE